MEEHREEKVTTSYKQTMAVAKEIGMKAAIRAILSELNGFCKSKHHSAKQIVKKQGHTANVASCLGLVKQIRLVHLNVMDRAFVQPPSKFFLLSKRFPCVLYQIDAF